MIIAVKEWERVYCKVAARGKGPEPVALEHFSPVPAMVLDLPELRDAIVAGTPMPT